MRSNPVRTLFFFLSLMCSNITIGQMSSAIDVLQIASSQSPTTICYPVSLNVSGQMSSIFIHVGNNISISGNNIDITMLYSSNGTIIFTSWPFSHIFDIGNMTSGTYTVTATSYLDGNPQDTMIYDLIVAPSPLNASFTYPSYLCLGDSVELVNVSTGGITNLWYEDGIPVSQDTNYVFAPTSAGSVDVRLRILDGNCQHAMQVSIPVYAPPAMDSTSASHNEICLGDTVHFTSASSNTISFEWLENGITVGNTNNLSAAPSSSGIYNYQVVLDSPEGCQDTTSHLVEVFALPQVDLGPDTNDCFGPIMFDAGAGLSSYLWSDQSTNQTLTPSVSGNYSVTVVDINGCEASDMLMFESCASMDEKLGQFVSIYPNPVNATLNVLLEDEIGSVKLSLVNTQGQVVLAQVEFNSGACELDVSHLNDGIYYLQLKTHNYSQVFKVLKE
ncbi:MAG: T9SS type A sorting domain-containing protein [Crocinitomicaceae bacterium]